jgi:hypothetical protein
LFFFNNSNFISDKLKRVLKISNMAYVVIVNNVKFEDSGIKYFSTLNEKGLGISLAIAKKIMRIKEIKIIQISS